MDENFTGMAFAPPEAEAQKPKPMRMASDIGIGALYKIIAGNILLNIVTFGIYSFWGRTRVRKYLISHLRLAGFPFEYTGTGKELFYGFLKLYGIMIVYGAIAGALFSAHALLGLLAVLAIFPLIGAGFFLAVRYYVGRLTWKAIRFSLRGSVRDFALLFVGRSLFNILSLGILLPQAHIALWSYKANHAFYGRVPFAYAGAAGRLMKVHLLTFFLAAIFVVPGFAMIAIGQKLAEEPGREAMGLMIFPGLALFYLGRIPRFWYRAALWQEQLRGLELGGVRFRSSATGMDFLKLGLGNAALLIMTFGLAYPLVIARKMRFRARHWWLKGDLAALETAQAEKAKTALGDAAAPDIDLGSGFDLGL
jgi:uncharacterized membrane protein YjgN (DUF898 family)